MNLRRSLLTPTFRALFAVAFLACAAHLPAELVAVQATGSAGPYTGISGGGTIGWTFTPTVDLLVTHLGYFDTGGNGLIQNHAVGIWANGGSLLGSTTVTPASTVLDGFLYAAVTPISLLAGQVYVIGAEQTGGIDTYLSPGAGLLSFSVAPEITYGNGRIAPSGGFTRPDNLTSSGGRVGPNFLATVPEPTTTALFGVALLGMAGLSRRRTARGAPKG